MREWGYAHLICGSGNGLHVTSDQPICQTLQVRRKRAELLDTFPIWAYPYTGPNFSRTDVKPCCVGIHHRHLVYGLFSFAHYDLPLHRSVFQPILGLEYTFLIGVELSSPPRLKPFE